MHANTIPKISPTDNAFFLLEEANLMGDVGSDEGGDVDIKVGLVEGDVVGANDNVGCGDTDGAALGANDGAKVGLALGAKDGGPVVLLEQP